MEINELVAKAIAFRDARDWKQFHTPNQLAAAIAIEAAELQEKFLWKSPAEVKSAVDDPARRQAITEELADVMIFSLMLVHELDSDPAEIITRKLAQNAKKYPVEKARGNAAKYTDL